MKHRLALAWGLIVAGLPAFAGLDQPAAEKPAVATVSRNQSVLLVALADGIRLSAPGRALKDGQPGETIPVLNTATRIPLKGVVRDGWIEIIPLETPAP